MKPLSATLMALLAAFAVASCGGDGDGEQQPPPKAASTQPSDAEQQRDAERSRSSEKPKRESDSGRGERRAAKQKTPPVQQEPAQPEQQNAQPPASSPSQEPRLPAKQQNAKDAARLERRLRASFGGGHGAKAAWYDDVQDVQVSNGRTTIETDLSGAESHTVALAICTSVRGLLPGVTDVVRVTGPPGNSTLAKCEP